MGQRLQALAVGQEQVEQDAVGRMAVELGPGPGQVGDPAQAVGAADSAPARISSTSRAWSSSSSTSRTSSDPRPAPSHR